MIIRNSYYNDSARVLYVEFSTKEDGDKFYRVLELSYDDVQYYSPEIISESDLFDIDEFFLQELIEEYMKDNDLPLELVL